MGVLEPVVEENMGKIKNNRSSDTVMEYVMYAIAVVFLIILMYPLYFIIIASFSDPSAVAGGQVWLFPKGFTFDGYKELLRHENIWIGYRNTVLYTVAGTAIGLVVNISAAYALSRKDLAGRKFLSLFFIFTMFFNGGLIPTFLTIRDFHMYDTFLVMVLPFSVGVYNIIVARTFFRPAFPEICGKQRRSTAAGTCVTLPKWYCRSPKLSLRCWDYGLLWATGILILMR